ncbi:MAG: DUF6345 domain-containing protein [Coriobacteriia bacterium]|nr:DUF6345 domain-containing protein [Coriobacteriia bacterium]
MRKRFLVLLACCLASAAVLPASGLAAGKTMGAYECNNYSTSDAKVFYDGVKSKVAAYGISPPSELKLKSGIVYTSFDRKDLAVKYWASHGDNSGNIWGDNGVGYHGPTLAKRWVGGNLEFVFLAACRQLDGLGTNPRARYANSMVGSQGLRVIAGYHESAPGSGGDYIIAQTAINEMKNGESVKSAWMKANTAYSSTTKANYCVLTHSGSVQYSRFEGFPGSTYPRPGASSTSILRFTNAYPNGTSQPRISSAAAKTVPAFALKARPRSIKFADTAKRKSYVSFGQTKLSASEIKGIPLSRTTTESASAFCNSWLQQSVDGLSPSDVPRDGYEVSPVVMAEVNLEGRADKEIELPVAYTLSFEGSYKGIRVPDNRFVAIVDDAGLNFAAATWADFEEVPLSAEPMTASAARDILVADTKKRHKVRDKAIRQGRYTKLDKSMTAASSVPSDAELVFALDADSGLYRPAWEYKTPYGLATIDCMDGDLSYR